ncbi:MAG: pyridoxamine 5'-phosphate oxidase family protein [Halieaceae bacterium]|nr:pyridoxamine 5'-phosphate oxidase family protein [Halieaceae bacterium]MCP5204984.1 pyridoxamine 5'-phosphate oxidase family protein [Pseudomonadales bacterium]
MAERFAALADRHIEFIGEQQMFFVGTAAAEGHVNVSPKGMDTFRVISPTEVAWLNLTGSGNECAAHVRDNPRMTIMFCSFGKQPLILRLYGRATALHPRDGDWAAMLALFPPDVGARQVFRLQLELVLTSCGYAVPRYELLGERPTLQKWAETRGREGIEQYWQEKNVTSLDGRDTGILGDTD